MSLSFVSKAVQTSREDGGFDERPIEGGGGSAGSQGSGVGVGGGSAKPLFEQLRQNKEQEDAEREEFQRSVMRGTLALDEEDCAHLDSLRKTRENEKMQLEQQTERELEAFRAAQAMKRDLIGDDDDDGGATESTDVFEKGAMGAHLTRASEVKDGAAVSAAASAKPNGNTIVPKIIVKKRKRNNQESGGVHTRKADDNGKNSGETPGDVNADGSGSNPQRRKKMMNDSETTGQGESATEHGDFQTGSSTNARGTTGLGGLLTGYGSSSDEEDS